MLCGYFGMALKNGLLSNQESPTNFKNLSTPQGDLYANEGWGYKGGMWMDGKSVRHD
jgi:hypothetical protein